jgi:hypothetical protein
VDDDDDDDDDDDNYVRGPCNKFMDPPCYSELELYGGAGTVSFSKYLP